MNIEQWWKNFAMGIELDISGAFIYNALKQLHVIESLSYSCDIFEIFYGLSVGIERLQKITIVLLEHNENEDIEKFEESLITHSTIELSNRIDKIYPQNLSDIQKEFLSILSKFYKKHRYGRFSILSNRELEAEKALFIRFICKHLQLKEPGSNEIVAFANSNQIKKFIGKIINKISKGLYECISNSSRKLNLYTYELRYNSKASKIFLGERCDFIDEDIIRREILLYLMNVKSDDDHLKMINGFDALSLDPGLSPAYIKALITDSVENHDYVSGDVEANFEEISNVKDRIELLSLLDNEYLSHDDDDV